MTSGMRKAIAVLISWILVPNAKQALGQQTNPSWTYQKIEREVARETDITISDDQRSKSRAKLRALRKQLTETDARALFAISKLGEILSSERAQAIADDCKPAFSEDIARKAPLKFQLIEALAEAYPKLSVELKGKILQTLQSAYTPVIACDLHGGRTVLDWALVHIGKDSLGVAIHLAQSSARSVRCAAVDLLNEIARTAEAGKNGPAAPAFSCATVADAVRQSEGWLRWWQENGTKTPLPALAGADPPM